MTSSVRILIVDEQEVFRQALRAHLEQADDLMLIGEAQDRQTAIEQIGELEPDVILLSLNAPHPDDAQIVARINKQYPHVKILVLGVYDDQVELMLDVFRKGAQGYLDKSASPMTDIVAAIRTLSRGGAILDSGMAGWILSEIACMRRQNAVRTAEGDALKGNRKR